MYFSPTPSVDENVIIIHDNKNIKFPNQDFVNITLKCGWNISQIKNHYLVLKMAIAGFKRRLPFVALSDSHPMLYIGFIE